MLKFSTVVGKILSCFKNDIDFYVKSVLLFFLHYLHS